jgi:hypothetical protein
LTFSGLPGFSTAASKKKRCDNWTGLPKSGKWLYVVCANVMNLGAS